MSGEDVRSVLDRLREVQGDVNACIRAVERANRAVERANHRLVALGLVLVGLVLAGAAEMLR